MGAKRRTIIEVIIEKHGGILWGRVEDKGNFLPTPYGKTPDKVIKNLKELIKDYQAHEGKKDRFWKAVDVENMDVEFVYDLVGFFEHKKYLNLSAVAEKVGINRSLMAQYAAGIKYPSQERAEQIEKVIHELGRDLLSSKIATRSKAA